MAAFTREDGVWSVSDQPNGHVFNSGKTSAEELDYNWHVEELWNKFKAARANANFTAEEWASLKPQILGGLENGKYANISESPVPGQSQFAGFDFQGQDTSVRFGAGDAQLSKDAQAAAVEADVKAYLLKKAKDKSVTLTALPGADINNFIKEAGGYRQDTQLIFNGFTYGSATGSKILGVATDTVAAQKTTIRTQIEARLNAVAGSLATVTSAAVDDYIDNQAGGFKSQPVETPLAVSMTGALGTIGFVKDTGANDNITFEVSNPDPVNYDIHYKVIGPSGKIVYDSAASISMYYDEFFSRDGFGDYRLTVTAAKKTGAAADVPPVVGTGEVYRVMFNMRWPIMGGGPEMVVKAVVPQELKVRYTQLYADELAVAADTTAITDYYIYGANVTVNTSSVRTYELADRDIAYSGAVYKKLRLESIPGVAARTEVVPYYLREMNAMWALSLAWSHSWLTAPFAVSFTGELGVGALFSQQTIGAPQAEHAKYLDQIRTRRNIDESLFWNVYPFYNIEVNFENILETGFFSALGLHNFLPKTPLVNPHDNWLPDGLSVGFGYHKDRLGKFTDVLAQITGLAARWGEPNTGREYSLDFTGGFTLPFNEWLGLSTAHDVTLANLFNNGDVSVAYRGEFGPNIKLSGKKFRGVIGLNGVGEYRADSWWGGFAVSGRISERVN
ncbi:MAG: hypothetical protein LBD62_03820 [Candidatus Margulisbacteria bacterium]|nr:hypothetical protein [Candidatus Margulisiibacteriota bacterium]